MDDFFFLDFFADLISCPWFGLAVSPDVVCVMCMLPWPWYPGIAIMEGVEWGNDGTRADAPAVTYAAEAVGAAAPCMVALGAPETYVAVVPGAAETDWLW